MSLNVKNDEVHRFAAELARLAGKSMTTAITQAIRERLEREQRRRGAAGLASELMVIGRCCAARPLRDRRSPEEILYDDRGLNHDAIAARLAVEVLPAVAEIGRISPRHFVQCWQVAPGRNAAPHFRPVF